MGFRYDDDSGNGKWWEFMLGWKWPHQGLTFGYDIVEPYEQVSADEVTYYSILALLLSRL